MSSSRRSHLPDEPPASNTPSQLLRRALYEPVRPPDEAQDRAQLAELFPEYELIDRVAEGGFGVVWRAEHRRLKRPVALKILTPALTRNPSALARFEREMEACGVLDDPGIVRTFDAGERRGVWFLAMEWLEGATFAALPRPTPLAGPDACELIRQVAVALSHAHERGMIHRDIKPGNLMLARTPAGAAAKVLDFGVAQLSTSGGSALELTATGEFVGTLDFASPEQIERPAAVNARSDVFSLGATFFWLLTATAPRGLGGGTTSSLYERVQRLAREPAPSIGVHRPDLPRELIVFIDRMLALVPGERPGSCDEIAATLAPYCGGHDLPALLERVRVPPPPILARIGASTKYVLRVSRLAWVIVAAALCAAAVLTGVRYFRPKPAGKPAPQAKAPPPQAPIEERLPAAMLAELKLPPAHAPVLTTRIFRVGNARRFDCGVRSAHYRPSSANIHFCTDSGDIALFLSDTRQFFPKLAAVNAWALAIAPDGHWLVWSTGAGDGRIGRGELANPFRPTSAPIQTTPGHRDSPGGVTFIPPRWDPTDNAFRPLDAVVVDGGEAGTPGLWRFRTDSEAPPHQVLRDPEPLRGAVDVTANIHAVYVICRSKSLAALHDDSTRRLLRLDGRGIAWCRTDRPLTDPCAITSDPVSGGLFVLCGQNLAATPELRRLVLLLPDREPDTFLVRDLFTRLDRPSDAGVDATEDGSRVLVSDAGARILYELERK